MVVWDAMHSLHRRSLASTYCSATNKRNPFDVLLGKIEVADESPMSAQARNYGVLPEHGIRDGNAEGVTSELPLQVLTIEILFSDFQNWRQETTQ
ncbi:hypothetical protein EGR_05715 [Echinococcus granulosus]|uniref:Uncharacterized protein n=1 Tax=Echinococcus granulosus TaxID=6210 RepID=W6V0Z1_ECHGR|nr:hypothetical protein EGR_05715 [Echinococcus granulosus]EUB59464.1 hypothetical protein EGR_05715 [Echinococcus granulosus]